MYQVNQSSTKNKISRVVFIFYVVLTVIIHNICNAFIHLYLFVYFRLTSTNFLFFIAFRLLSTFVWFVIVCTLAI